MANHPIPQRLFGFAAKLESSGGSAETISKSTDAIQLAEPGTLEGPLAIEPNRREGAVAGSLNARAIAPSDPSGLYYRVSGRIPARGAGSAYSASNLPPEDPILVAGGLARTVTATSGSESAAYDPTDDPNTGTNDTITMEVQTHNREYVLKGGALESLQLVCSAGGIAYWEFTALGIYDSDTEQALESHTYSTSDLAIWKNSGPLDIGGVTSIIGKSFTLDMGLTTAIRAAPDADGIALFKITGRNPMLSITAETLAKSTWDPEADHRASTQRTTDIVIGGTQYKRLKVDVDDMYVDGPVGRIDQDELVHFEVDYAIGTAGTNEVQFLYD